MIWRRSNRFDQSARLIADRHYNRQKPGTPQFVPPGRCVVLVADHAMWVTSWPFAEYVRHDWPGAWVCSAFRNEGSGLSSGLIRDAVAATRQIFGDPPPTGMVTFVDPNKTRRKRDPGRCYLRAGFVRPPCPRCGGFDVYGPRCRVCSPDGKARTAGGLVVLQMWPNKMPPAEAPYTDQMSLWDAVTRPIARKEAG